MSKKKLCQENNKSHYVVDTPEICYRMAPNWYGKNKSVRVQGYNINGFVYVGSYLPDYEGFNDVCLINPFFPVEDSEQNYNFRMESETCYELLTPICRDAYLKWLSSGCKKEGSCSVFLYLYVSGLERRLFLDGYIEKISDLERFSLVSEVMRLLELHKSDQYFVFEMTHFLALDWVLHGFRGLPPKLVLSKGFKNMVYSSVIPLQYAHNGKPLPCEEALSYGLFGQRLRRTKRRISHDDKDLKKFFSNRYRQRFGEGAMLSPSGEWQSVPIKMLNRSLKGLNLRVSHLPDMKSPEAPLGIIRQMMNECLEELNSYLSCREFNYKPEDFLRVLLKTPLELLDELPGFEEMKIRLIEACPQELLLTWPELQNLLELVKSQHLKVLGNAFEPSCKYAIKLAMLAERAGFLLFPDYRYIDVKFDDNTRLLLVNFSEAGFPASKEYLRMNMVIALGVMAFKVFNDDLGEIRHDILNELIVGNKDLSSPEKKSLSFFLSWCEMEKWRILPAKRNHGLLKEAEKQAIISGFVLERDTGMGFSTRFLQKLDNAYACLGFSRDKISGDLYLPLVSQDISERSEELAVEFKLDKAAIERGLIETAQVRAVLEEVFVEDEEDEGLQGNAVALLDPAHEKLLHYLIEREVWNREELEKICVGMSLFLDSALENINDWFFDKTDSLLVEEWGNFYVDVEKAGECGLLKVQERRSRPQLNQT